jgi:hypothetical protein
MRSSESDIGFRMFLNSCASRRATSRHAASRSASMSESRADSSRAVMALNDSASVRISCAPSGFTRVPRSPPATRSNAAASTRSGRVMPRASDEARMSAPLPSRTTTNDTRNHTYWRCSFTSTPSWP